MAIIITKTPSGKAEIERLRAENEQLKTEVETQKALSMDAFESENHRMLENNELRAENERLALENSSLRSGHEKLEEEATLCISLIREHEALRTQLGKWRELCERVTEVADTDCRGYHRWALDFETLTKETDGYGE